MATHRSQQIEVSWDAPEAFQLLVQTAVDGDKIAAQQAQSQTDKQHAEKQQPELV